MSIHGASSAGPSFPAVRSLAAPPATVLDPATGAPRTGSYRGPLPRVDLAAAPRGALWRLAHRKRWIYVAIVSDDLFLGVAIVHLGYLANAFAFAFERGGRGLGVDRSSVGPPFAARVGDVTGEGCTARYRLGGMALDFARAVGSQEYVLDVRVRDLVVRARIAAAPAPPPIAAIVPIAGGLVNATEKRALLTVAGEATVCGRRHGLDGALAGFDYTQGYLARRTSWRWAFALGRARSGERVGLNLVEGFVGEPECALWVDDALVPLGEGRFTFDRARPLAPWTLGSADGRVDLRFTPGGVHAEQKNLGLLASRFLQPVGVFDGSIAVDGRRRLELDGVLGVAEDQDVLW